MVWMISNSCVPEHVDGGLMRNEFLWLRQEKKTDKRKEATKKARDLFFFLGLGVRIFGLGKLLLFNIFDVFLLPFFVIAPK